MRVVARVPSLTSTDGTRYDISVGPRGDVVCACPAFGAHRVDETTDKHVAIYRAAKHALDRCRAAGHIDTSPSAILTVDAICFACLVDVFAAAAAKFKRTEKEKFRAVDSLRRTRAKVHDIRARKKKR